MPGGVHDLRRPAQLGLHVGGDELLDQLPAERSVELPAHHRLAAAHNGERAGRIVEAAPQRGEPLVAHQHQEVDLGQMARSVRIEAAGPVLDGPGPVEGQGLTGRQLDALEPLRRQPLDGIAVERLAREAGRRVSASGDLMVFPRGCPYRISLFGALPPHYISGDLAKDAALAGPGAASRFDTCERRRCRARWWAKCPCCRRDAMNFDKYTDRAKGLVQAAQSLALREGHQQFGTDHLLKVAHRRPRGPGGAHRPACRRAARRRQGGHRAGAGEAPQGLRRRCRPGLPRARAGARVRHRREARRARPATSSSRSSACCSLWPWSPRPTPAVRSTRPASTRPRSTAPSTTCARAAPPTAPPPSRATTP